MVVKMMKWRPWPPLLSKKYEVRLVLRRLEGYYNQVGEGAEKVAVEIRWKGPKIALMSSLRRTVKRNFTEAASAGVGENGVVEWGDEEFQGVCTLSGYRDNVFHPWEITFTVFNGLNQGPKIKVPIVGRASLNLAEFASRVEEKDFDLKIPLISGSAAEPSLHISLSLLELRTGQESAVIVQRSVCPPPSNSPLQSTDPPLSTDKDELSVLKAGLRKVKIFTDYVSTRRAKKPCHEEEGSEGRSEDGDYTYPLDSDSLDEFPEGESDEGKTEDSRIRKSFSYGTLAYANCIGGSIYSDMTEDEDWIYSNRRKSDVGCSQMEDSATSSTSEPSLFPTSKRSIILPWRKRKLNFRSPKAKGEPLLKKAYGEEGGDDIDFDRRQLSSDESFSFGWQKTDEDSSANRSSISEFGDDNFAIGSWEHKEVTSRDGHMKLQTQVFFASIDQRSERAAGESACTALVAVIADWFQNNKDLMPIKSQLDSLIRDGSLEWRNLCENEMYRLRFPDKHFDLETVLQAKIRPLSVVPSKSFIGFFRPDGITDEGKFDFLHGAMSFDNIWDEITHLGSECLFIVSWNDHFFVLKVEPEAYYIVDTLGERLYEGCNQAYILKFDKDSMIYKLMGSTQSSEELPPANQQIVDGTVETKNQTDPQINSKEGFPVEGAESMKSEDREEVLFCRGKESCKEYVKSFLAAIPIRELQADIKKGLIASTPLHHRLQIEFHYTQVQPPQPLELPQTEAAAAMMLLFSENGEHSPPKEPVTGDLTSS
ncbi:uncharacterized protein LOC131318546 [Rhododendron vialii]|uniref:uncharacterized protein LOC131318546 n=1 Tax=Rhododendron vialii TaxID=182163 RepID=UPI00265E3D8F|nr:uncharacterized protein LOC131318546 [Rhododendron vialii]